MEVVGEEAVVTTSCLLLEVDLYTCTLDHPLLSSPFHLEVLRRDFLTAFFLYFDVTFSHGMERVVLSTYSSTSTPVPGENRDSTEF